MRVYVPLFFLKLERLWMKAIGMARFDIPVKIQISFALDGKKLKHL